MTQQAPSISEIKVAVIIPTFNRADILLSAIESVLEQQPQDPFELFVVDNNSNDGTKEAIDAYVKQSQNVRYLFEPLPGASRARNLGITCARADIVAFLDDDVRAGEGWIETIIDTFDRHPNVTFIGGKVLPDWCESPPEWLTRDRWSPLALVDYGDRAFYIDRDRPVCLVSANLAIRRSAFDEFGLFNEKFLRCEDHELEDRILNAGGRGLYVPTLKVHTTVPPVRLLKDYHRRWHSERGFWLARVSALRIGEESRPTGQMLPESALFEVPASMYRQLVTSLLNWLKSAVSQNEHASFKYETDFRYFRSFIKERYKLAKVRFNLKALKDLVAFVSTLLFEKLGVKGRSK